MTTSNGLNNTELAKVRRYLINRFSQGELQSLSFDMGIEYQNLSHNTKLDFALDLLGYVVRDERLSELLELALKEHKDTMIAELLNKLNDNVDNLPTQTNSNLLNPTDIKPEEGKTLKVGTRKKWLSGKVIFMVSSLIIVGIVLMLLLLVPKLSDPCQKYNNELSINPSKYKISIYGKLNDTSLIDQKGKLDDDVKLIKGQLELDSNLNKSQKITSVILEGNDITDCTNNPPFNYNLSISASLIKKDASLGNILYTFSLNEISNNQPSLLFSNQFSYDNECSHNATQNTAIVKILNFLNITTIPITYYGPFEGSIEDCSRLKEVKSAYNSIDVNGDFQLKYRNVIASANTLISQFKSLLLNHAENVNLEARYLRAKLLLGTMTADGINNASKDFDIIINGTDDVKNIRFFQGLAHFYRGDAEKAIEAFSIVDKTSDFTTEAHLFLSELYALKPTPNQYPFIILEAAKKEKELDLGKDCLKTEYGYQRIDVCLVEGIIDYKAGQYTDAAKIFDSINYLVFRNEMYHYYRKESALYTALTYFELAWLNPDPLRQSYICQAYNAVSKDNYNISSPPLNLPDEQKLEDEKKAFSNCVREALISL